MGTKPLVIDSPQAWKQAAFNGAFRGLRWQGFRRAVVDVDEDGDVVCMLRTPDGLACAGGWLVPNEQIARLRMEDPNRLTGNARVSDLTPILRDSPHADSVFIGELTGCHDDACNPTDVERHLRTLAADHNLTIPDEGE